MSYVFTETQLAEIQQLFYADRDRILYGVADANYADMQSYISHQFLLAYITPLGNVFIQTDAVVDRIYRWFVGAAKGDRLEYSLVRIES